MRCTFILDWELGKKEEKSFHYSSARLRRSAIAGRDPHTHTNRSFFSPSFRFLLTRLLCITGALMFQGWPLFWPLIKKKNAQYQLCGFSLITPGRCVYIYQSSSPIFYLSVSLFFFVSFCPWHLPTCHDPLEPPMTDYIVAN